MNAPHDVLVPPRRLGALLREAREAAGVDLDTLAERSGRLTLADLDDLEAGRRHPSDDVLRHVVRLYGLDDATLVPGRSRLVIDLDEGRIAVDDADVVLDNMSSADAVLARYLALVYRLRGLPVGTPLGLRELDVDVLASALSLRTGDVDARLQGLIAEGSVVAHHERPLRRRLLVPLAGVVVAATAAGVLLIVNDDGQPTVTNPPPATSIAAARSVDAGPVVVDVGTPAVAEAPVPHTTDAEPATTADPASGGVPETEIIDAVVLEADGEQQTRD